ncbi:alpha/beta hydrolase [Alteraurantiacibacter aestuarii]|uniref:Alpha/beta hydrolase fold domain-containing protein n=1 Tax=Alteraurantiacibacter aestuarii TaxID=650004 RepID=A0A844ZJV9_9SPHN|nr:alpha/beta hydrolase [Alteraurantiacibacter aestuarii]MXO88068.1 alpha/beta hydrolase fold domain-containing protein [Alteraurantiacibacter aestuarii]
MISRRNILRSTAGLAGAAAVARVQPALAHDLEEIMLWPGDPPGNGRVRGPEEVGGPGTGYGAVSNISTPRMRVYRPNVANGKAVLVCGGGGYFRIQLWKESTPIASLLALKGYTVFELIYRLPNDGWDASAPFMDAQRAMKIIRSRAADFGIRPDRIGIMGFSAGGHLAGYTALLPDQQLYAGGDSHEAQSARPDFSALLFPVVSMRAPFDTTRTRREIIGDDANRAAEDAWSLDTHASGSSPPTLIISAADDTITPPGHGISLFQALRARGAPAELHIFEDGGHGWGLGTDNQILSQWPDIFENWIGKRTFE